jgi:hypothetical protein
VMNHEGELKKSLEKIFFCLKIIGIGFLILFDAS